MRVTDNMCFIKKEKSTFEQHNNNKKNKNCIRPSFTLLQNTIN